MQSFEEYGPLYLESRTFLTAIAGLPPTSRENVIELEDILRELSDDCPYVGQPVIVSTNQPTMVVDSQTGKHSVEQPGEIDGTLDKLFMYVSEDGANIGLQVRLDGGDGEDALALIDFDSVTDIELQEQRQPFFVEESKFHNLMDEVKKKAHLFDDETLDNFISEYIAHNITAQSALIGCKVELLICKIAEIDIFGENIMSWNMLAAIGKTATECIERVERSKLLSGDFGDDVDFLGDDDFYSGDNSQEATDGDTVDYRGPITAKVIDFSYEWLEPSVEPRFKVIVELEPEHNLVDNPSRRYAAILVEDISQGKAISGPAFN